MTRTTALKRALRAGGASTGLIKGDASAEPEEGLVPGYSASGQDVWLPEATHFGPGLVLSAVGARCGKVFQADGKWSVVANTTVLTPQPGNDPRFLWYLVNNEEFWEKGGTAQPYVRVPETLARRVWLPDLPEQRTIADYLDTETARIDALITKKRRLIELLDEQRQAITHSGVTGTAPDLGFSTRESSLPWAKQVGESFDEVLLRLVARQGTGHTPSRDHSEWWVPGECVIPWVTTGEVQQVRSDETEFIYETREKISEVGVENSSAEVHPAGTVFLCRTASAGYSGIMGTNMATSQDFATWSCGPKLRPRYLLLCLRTMRADLLGRLATGSTHKTIYMPDILALRIPLPSIPEQDRIVDWVWTRLRRSFAASRAIERQISVLKEYRQALITAAVAGELEIPGAA